MNEEIKQFYKNKTILVTGGCGSVGSAIVGELLKINVKLILFCSLQFT